MFFKLMYSQKIFFWLFFIIIIWVFDSYFIFFFHPLGSKSIRNKKKCKRKKRKKITKYCKLFFEYIIKFIFCIYKKNWGLYDNLTRKLWKKKFDHQNNKFKLAVKLKKSKKKICVRRRIKYTPTRIFLIN